jgi:hypothetical protein
MFTLSFLAAHPRKPGMLEGLSRFLVQHERCGAGFDVAHPAGLGSGRVSITCRGCGARHEYATATIEVEREVRIEPAQRGTEQEQEPGTARPIPPRAAPYPESRQIAEEEVAELSGPRTAEEILRAHAAKTEGAGRRRTGPGIGAPPRGPGPGERLLRSPGAIPALVAVLAVALGLGVVWLVDELGGDDSSTEPVAAPPAMTAPEPPVQTAPAPPPGPPPSPVPGAPEPKIETVRTERYALQVPRGWSRRTVDGSLLLEPAGGGRASVRIFYENSPQLTASQMANQTTAFMSRLVPGARLLDNEARIAGESAFELTARGPGETAIAVNVLRGPYRYLLLRRIFAGAKPQTSQAASRIVLSFTPR